MAQSSSRNQYVCKQGVLKASSSQSSNAMHRDRGRKPYAVRRQECGRGNMELN